ncbi:MAG: type II toxin-antitoxin system HicB family antitoxin, partial [Acidobacteria bacterium]|nr:type II toxin-antitoxin system HicB family antitoxin [Acidobacteriota bacterium]
MKEEGDWYVSECLSFPVTSQGRKDTEAMANLMEAIQLFVESCLDRGTLEQVLVKHQ